MAAMTDSGRETVAGMRELVAVAQEVVATTFPLAADVTVVLTLPGYDDGERQVTEVPVPVGAALTPPRRRACDLWPVLERAARAVFPEAVRVRLHLTLPDGSPGWLPVSSAGRPASLPRPVSS